MVVSVSLDGIIMVNWTRVARHKRWGDFIGIRGLTMEKVLLDNGFFCTGCGACASVCPVSAISMEHDDEGFIKARIDHDACVKCGKCESTCPVMHPDYSNDEPVCHAMAATDDERELSSSGGIFPVLAKSVLAENGVVFGAAWNDDFSVSIRGVEDEEGLGTLRSSKYVQSSTEQTFNEVKKHLGDGRRVLYSGCPCQIAGLKASLGELFNDKNLLTVEVICHGAPPAKVLRDYLDEEFGIDNVTHIAFRDKKTFGWGVAEKVDLSDGSTSLHYASTSPFMKAFNPCLIMGRACGICPFAHLPRQADISLGDFWGIGKSRPDLNDWKGLSAVLVSSQRGKRAFDLLPDGTLLTDEVVPIEYASEINKTIYQPFENNPGRKHFFSSYGMYPFTTLTDSALNHYYDIGIVGLWYGINYGSILTYYALYEVLRKIGKDPVMLPKPNGMWSECFDDPESLAQKFINKRCNVFQPYPSLGEYVFANDNCKAFIVGSDVVWSYDVCGREVDQFFFLDWVKRNHKKIAYAASIGSGLGENTKYVSEAIRELQQFDALSVREEDGVKVLNDLTGREDVRRVLDPVFLYGAEAFSAIADDATDWIAPEGCLFSYILQSGLVKEKREWVSLIADHLGVEPVVIGNASDYDAARSLIGPDAVLGISVESWIKSIRDSKFYFGDSYHGLCFALMYHVPFMVAYREGSPTRLRSESLLSLLGLEERLVTNADATDEEILAIVNKEIDWDAVDAALAKEVASSLAWLSDAVSYEECPCELDATDRLHDKMIDRMGVQARDSRIVTDGIKEELDEQRQQIATLMEELRDLREQKERQEEDFQRVLASRSFKLGRAFTWLPRRIRDGVAG